MFVHLAINIFAMGYDVIHSGTNSLALCRNYYHLQDRRINQQQMAENLFKYTNQSSNANIKYL